MEQAVVASQFDGLANSPQCSLDATSLDHVASSKLAFLDPLSKNMQDQQFFCWSQV